MYMKSLLEKLIEEAEEGAAEVQIVFKTSSIVPTPKGPMATTLAAGALVKGPVEGTFCLITKGEGPNRELVIAEVLFEADQVCRVERIKGKMEAPRVVPVGGGLVMPR